MPSDFGASRAVRRSALGRLRSASDRLGGARSPSFSPSRARDAVLGGGTESGLQVGYSLDGLAREPVEDLAVDSFHVLAVLDIVECIDQWKDVTNPMESVLHSDLRGRRALPVMIIGLLAFALVGCSGVASDADAQAPGSEASTPEETEASENAGDGDASARLGTITVDTTTHTVIESVNCEPMQSTDIVTETFSSIAVGQTAEGEEVLFFAYTHEGQSGGVSNFIDYQGPEGTWSSSEGNATFTLNEGTLSGASVIVNDDASQSKMIQFSFTLPDTLVEC
ncbi:MAG: hypothetical protein GXX90_08930 [Microbacteriaceae bacterium]|nr:hypothetical protein [Microbacteriaceae bacterium]